MAIREWTLECSTRDDSVQVFFNRKLVLDAVDLDAAEWYVKRQTKKEDRIYVVEPDGYRTEITKDLGRGR